MRTVGSKKPWQSGKKKYLRVPRAGRARLGRSRDETGPSGVATGDGGGSLPASSTTNRSMAYLLHDALLEELRWRDRTSVHERHLHHPRGEPLPTPPPRAVTELQRKLC
jgi:hypothetical protein